MNKKIVLGGTVLASVLLGGMSVFAAAPLPSTSPAMMTHTAMTANVDSSAATKIACVGAAVATREASIDAAIATHGTALSAAYTARASALATAYSGTKEADVKTGIRSAWLGFATAVKAASSTWKSSQQSAWTTFRTAAKACKASTTVSDSTHATGEVSAQ